MTILIYLLLIPLTVYVVSRYLDARYQVGGSQPLLVLACVLFGLSILLPSPAINGEDTEFFTHLLGGGVFTGMLWLYFRPATRPRRWHVELLYVLALVSLLGVSNELFELLMYSLHITSEPLTDTSWDLLANTVGALLFYGCYRVTKYLKTLFLQR